MQKQLKELHPGHSGPFAPCERPSPSPELEVDRTDKTLALRAFMQHQSMVLVSNGRLENETNRSTELTAVSIWVFVSICRHEAEVIHTHIYTLSSEFLP